MGLGSAYPHTRYPWYVEWKASICMCVGEDANLKSHKYEWVSTGKPEKEEWEGREFAKNSASNIISSNCLGHPEKG